MAELKTKLNAASVTKFLNTITDEQKRKDCFALVELMKKVSKKEAKMWGTAIVGFDQYHYKYESGREGDMCIVGFSPRKAAISVYLMCSSEAPKELMKELGKYKLGGGCLYIKNLEDVDQKVLGKLIAGSIAATKKKYPAEKKKK